MPHCFVFVSMYCFIRWSDGHVQQQKEYCFVKLVETSESQWPPSLETKISKQAKRQKQLWYNLPSWIVSSFYHPFLCRNSSLWFPQRCHEILEARRASNHCAEFKKYCTGFIFSWFNFSRLSRIIVNKVQPAHMCKLSKTGAELWTLEIKTLKIRKFGRFSLFLRLCKIASWFTSFDHWL